VDQDPLVDIAADLYALPPEDFVPARDDAVKRARQAGDKRLATAVGKLRKPTVGAWAVNLLAHERPDLVDDLLDLGEELRSAQRNLRGDELRDLSMRRRKLISELARTAVTLARRRNLPVPEIEATFTAALADEEVAAAVRLGVLAKTVEYAGFGETPRPQLRLLQGGAAAGQDVAAIDVGLSSPARTKKVGPDSPTSISDAQRRRAERERAGEEAAEEEAAEQEAAEQTRREQESRAKREREAAERAEREAEEREAAELAERKAAERDEARRRSAELKRARAAAHRELLAARTELSEAEAARVTAERAVTVAKRRVEKATAAVNALDE
jgi:hypothetical protein